MSRVTRWAPLLGMLAGCAGGPAAAVAPAAAPAGPPAAARAVVVEEPASTPEDGSLSGPEAAVVLRRTALMRAMAWRESYQAAIRLGAVWEDASGRPEEEALLELLDRQVLTRTTSTGRSAFRELRMELARAWLDRGNRDRARAHVAALSPHFVEDQVELAAALDGRDAARRAAESEMDSGPGALEIERARFDWILTMVDARWGNAKAAEQVLPALAAREQCRLAVALARRQRRDRGSEARKWLDLAQKSLAAVDPGPDHDFRWCVADLVEESLARGEEGRAVSALATMPWAIEDVCGTLHELVDRAPATLLDAPLLAGIRFAAEDPHPTWQGCPGVLGELAARRGDRPVAGRLLLRAITEADDGGEGARYDYTWTMSVRLGRVDPLASHAVGQDGFRTLALARILDERPDQRVAPGTLAAALESEFPVEDPGDEETNRSEADGDDASGDAANDESPDGAPDEPSPGDDEELTP